MAEKTLEELTAENAALREFVRVTARVPVKEVWYHGMFATTWKCLSCGYDAGVPGALVGLPCGAGAAVARFSEPE